MIEGQCGDMSFKSFEEEGMQTQVLTIYSLEKSNYVIYVQYYPEAKASQELNNKVLTGTELTANEVNSINNSEFY
jgi:uncharacterized protein YfaP (DUF2135 family)